MAVLVDTNILLRLLQPHHPYCPIAERALNILRLQEEALTIAHPTVVEFWAVATRPSGENGLGFDIDRASLELSQVKRLFSLLPEAPLGAEWERLVKTYRVSGRNTHDARLVAAMSLHAIDRILTFNVVDFRRYLNIAVVDPMAIK